MKCKMAAKFKCLGMEFQPYMHIENAMQVPVIKCISSEMYLAEMGKGKFSYDDFYKAAKTAGCTVDVFRCVNDDRIYISIGNILAEFDVQKFREAARKHRISYRMVREDKGLER